MHPEGLVGALDAHGHIHPALDVGIFLIFFPKLSCWRIGTDHLLKFGGFTPHHRNKLGQPVGIAIGNIEHPGHILEHGLGSHAVEGDDLSHLLLPVALGDIIDNLTAALDTEVGINIRHRLALRIQEALKQQTVLYGIDGGDPQGIGHQGASR